MKIQELYDLIDPTLIWENAMDNQANVDSWYLYELHNFHHNNWGGNVWIFNGINDFVNFLPALILNDLLYLDENLGQGDAGNTDVSDRYAEYLETKQGTWDEERCLNFVRDFQSPKLKLKEFSRVSTFFDVTTAQFELCKSETVFDPELYNGLTESMFVILHKFSEVSDLCPALAQSAFLNFINGEINESLS
jgi:hypothetical protein